MKKKLQILALITILVLPIFLYAQVTAMEDADFKKLSKAEKDQYNAAVENEMAQLQQRRADANAREEELNGRKETITAQLDEENARIQELFAKLGISEEDIAAIHTRIQYYKDQLGNWENMNDDQLWNNAKAFKELQEDYGITYNLRLSRLPEFERDWNDLNRRFTSIDNTLDRLRQSRGYYEDNYAVQGGDTLSKISGYDFIYGDPSKWGIIYRANRDQISNPNIIHVGQNLKIPRGLPTSWKVYRGESLWRIASYPEVYGTGTKWPLIHRANADQIRDPNLIYPNQVFSIPRD